MSIRGRLVLILMVATGIVWMSAIAWIYLHTRSDVERVLDARLGEAARMVSSLVSTREIEVADAAGLVGLLESPSDHTGYERQLSCQLWSLDGELVGRSEGAPTEPLSNHDDGFGETEIDGERWRVFALSNPESGVRVLVGDSLAVREKLVGDVITGLLVPAALVLPLMAGIILISVNQGLLPLERTAAELRTRSADDLSPLTHHGPREVRPILEALNSLFSRVDHARERERNFTAFAAHELRTPLTGLKTQAQIAIRSEDPLIRGKALEQLIAGVDRTSRMVRQLLAIAAVETPTSEPTSPVRDAGAALSGLFGSMALPPGVQVVGVDHLDGVGLNVSAGDFDLIFRNLLENAVAHSPSDGTISVSLDDSGLIQIVDQGPGMQNDELQHATERFFRGSNKIGLGSGLGLSIVEAAVKRSGGSLELVNGSPAGLRVLVGLPPLQT